MRLFMFFPHKKLNFEKYESLKTTLFPIHSESKTFILLPPPLPPHINHLEAHNQNHGASDQNSAHIFQRITANMIEQKVLDNEREQKVRGSIHRDLGDVIELDRNDPNDLGKNVQHGGQNGKEEPPVKRGGAEL